MSLLKSKDEKLVQACHYGQWDKVWTLLTNDADIKVNDYQPLEFAIRGKQECLVSVMVGSDPDKICKALEVANKEYDGKMELFLAKLARNAGLAAAEPSWFQNILDRTLNKVTCWGNLDMDYVWQLYEMGADVTVERPSIYNKFTNSAFLDLAGHEEAEPLLRQILAAREIPQRQKDESLMRAAGNGKTNIVRLLLEHGANPRADDDAALRYASVKGDAESIRLLLAAGCDVHAKNDEALRHAATEMHAAAADALLDAGADRAALDDEMLKLVLSGTPRGKYVDETDRQRYRNRLSFLFNHSTDIHAKGDLALWIATGKEDTKDNRKLLSLLADELTRRLKEGRETKEQFNGVGKCLDDRAASPQRRDAAKIIVARLERNLKALNPA